MIAMIRTFFHKKNFILISVVGVLCGILLACMEVVPGDEISLENAYLYARDGYIELSDREYCADVFNCLLNILFFVPFVSQFFISDYEIAKSFIFVRINNVSKWYRYKVFQSIIYSFYSSIVYNMTLLIMVTIMGFRTNSLFLVLEYLFLGIFAGFFILFLIVMGNNILCLKVSPHIGTSLIMGLTVLGMVITHFLNDKQIQFSLLTNYFISWHMIMNPNSVFYYYPTWVYYIVIIIIIILELLIGNIVVKELDYI